MRSQCNHVSMALVRLDSTLLLMVLSALELSVWMRKCSCLCSSLTRMTRMQIALRAMM